MALPSTLLQQVDQITLNYTAKAYQAIVDAHRTELRLMLVVYVALFGIAVLQGTLSMNLRDATKHLLKVLIFFQLATHWGSFTIFCYDVFTHGPEKITTALIGGSDPNQQLEEVFMTGMEAARLIYEKAGITDLSQVLLALMVFIGTLLMTGFALFLLILAKLGLAILLSIAPLFLIFGIWKSTQGLFQGWINYLVNYALIPVITFALLGLVLTLMKEPMNQIKAAGENLDLVTIIPFLLVGAISTLLFSQILRIASSLGGGVALSTMGSFNRYVNTPASNLLKSAATPVTRGGARLAKAGQASLAGRFRSSGSSENHQAPSSNQVLQRSETAESIQSRDNRRSSISESPASSSSRSFSKASAAAAQSTPHESVIQQETPEPSAPLLIVQKPAVSTSTTANSRFSNQPSLIRPPLKSSEVKRS